MFKEGELAVEGGQVEDEEKHQEQESKRRKLPQRKAKPLQMSKKMQNPQDRFEEEKVPGSPSSKIGNFPQN